MATGGGWDYGQMAWNGVGGGRANFAPALRFVAKWISATRLLLGASALRAPLPRRTTPLTPFGLRPSRPRSPFLPKYVSAFTVIDQE